MPSFDPARETSTKTIEYDAEQKKLTVRNAGGFPEEILTYPEPIEILDISDNSISTLPDEFVNLKDLRILFMSDNDFTEIPSVLGMCQKLEMVAMKSCRIQRFGDVILPEGLKGLTLTDNQLTQLPDTIGTYKNLQKLMLTGNSLTSLPQAVLACENLEVIRIANNHLTEPAKELQQLPKLAWFADSANSFQEAGKVIPNDTQEFQWDEIKTGKKIGESSKNVVYEATLPNGDVVALKLFGEGVTTDGLPENDIRACLLAGDHPNIIGGVGIITGFPEGGTGLVMPRVPESFKTLGFPPDNVTYFTRDHYAEGTSFSAAFIKRVAQSIASGLQHLHSRGISHGDVYAHNVLANESGEAKLGDFGAASVYTPNGEERWREKLDVLGYGRLLQELAERCSEPLDENLAHVIATSNDELMDNRPSFASIVMDLES